MKLSDYKGEDAIELLADIIEPAIDIISDDAIRDAVRANKTRMELIKLVLKGHKKEILEIMARIDGEDPATYQPNVFVLPMRLIELLNDSDLMELFRSQTRIESDASSGSAMEIIEVSGN